jgi:hypothetical protein
MSNANSDSIATEDPTIINAEPLTPAPEGYLTTDEEPTVLSEVSFEAGDAERTIAVGDMFIADNGQIVGEIKRITRREHTRRDGDVHTVWIDYGEGEHAETNATGGVPLGETAEQMADGDMTTQR